MRLKQLLIATASLAALLSPFAGAQTTDWVVRNSWTPALEDKFSEFVSIMGKTKCGSLNRCLKSADANPFYYKRTPPDFTYKADCADLPFALRMYFAWMEGLPFDYVSELYADGGLNGRTLNSSINGNVPTKYHKIQMGKVYDGPKEMRRMNDLVATMTYRMHHDYVSDFYPAGINKKDIRPGTVMYDPAGHAAIVYYVNSSDGSIKMMDAHPDQTISRITFDQKFVRSRRAHGAGFKNWRPELNYQPTADLPGFSTDRFKDEYSFKGKSMNYYEYVRTVMAGGNMHVDPINELKSRIAELCSNFQDRVAAVNDGLESGIQNKEHPANLPNNIYGTTGEWEDYSSPSRDARLKTGFVILLSETKRLVDMYKSGDERIRFTPVKNRYSTYCGNNQACYLGASLLVAYEEASQDSNCTVRYTKTNGETKKLGYEDIVARLFKLSFDPYHCAERRWGAEGSELSSCRDDRYKTAWYQNQQGLRNQIERKYDAVMSEDVNGVARLGVDEAPNVDLFSYLEGLLFN